MPNPATSTALSRIGSWLKENRSGYHSKLERGASAKQLDDLETQFHLKLPAGFRELYKWHNGQNPKVFANFTENWMFMSLREAAEAKAALDEFIDTEFAADEQRGPDWWRREWMPFLDNGGGDYMVADLSGEGAGRVLTYWHDYEKRETEHASIDEWIAEVARRMHSDEEEY